MWTVSHDRNALTDSFADVVSCYSQFKCKCTQLTLKTSNNCMGPLLSLKLAIRDSFGLGMLQAWQGLFKGFFMEINGLLGPVLAF